MKRGTCLLIDIAMWGDGNAIEKLGKEVCKHGNIELQQTRQYRTAANTAI
jgi:hypothetical protein